jgi:formyltetrahydrofolate-dependent phosphoribosylglycinamide formyltransferase
MSNKRVKLAVFISGGGSNLQSLIDAAKRGELSAEIALVVSSARDAYGLQRAANEGIETLGYRVKRYPSPEAAAADLLAKLRERGVEYVALAGYLKLMPVEIVRAYRGRIANIHPALLPKYGGKGMYGHHVHEAVIAAGDRESGPTVHLVDEVYDNGRILGQARVPVLADDTPDTLAARVLIEEHKLYPKILQKLIQGDYE